MVEDRKVRLRRVSRALEDAASALHEATSDLARSRSPFDKDLLARTTALKGEIELLLPAVRAERDAA